MTVGDRHIDLHLHSTASDGTLSPTELVARAVALGLSAIALTDHDSIGGLAAAAVACRAAGIELVTGVELSADVPKGTCHVLGYYVDPQDPAFGAWLEERRRARVDRGQEIVRRVNGALRDRLGAGAPQATWEGVARRANLAEGGAVGRPHVADELIAVGAITSRDEAFATLLGDGMPGDVPSTKLGPEEVIDVIRRAGGVAVLAHPTYLPGYEARLPALVEAGLGGLECVYGEYSAEVIAHLKEVAGQHGLVVTGGSDFHGPELGAGSGEMGVPAVPASLLGPLAALRPLSARR